MISISLIPSEILFQCVLVCVFIYSVPWIKCVCVGVLDWTCFQVHRQLHKTDAGEDPWQQMTDRQPHVDLRCLKQAVRKGKFHRVQTITQQALQQADSVWYGMSRSEVVNREQKQHGWQLCQWRLQQTGCFRCGGWGHLEVMVLLLTWDHPSWENRVIDGPDLSAGSPFLRGCRLPVWAQHDPG